MKNLVLTALAFLVFMTTANAQDGSWHYEKYWNGCAFVYRKVFVPDYHHTAPLVPVAPVVKKENTTTIVNNLIGIPVPVQYTQPIAQQGNTVYGYSTVAEAYGNVDLGLLYNQAARLTDQAQQLAGQAATDFSTLVQAEGYNRAEVAKIIAQGQAARDTLLAAKGPPTAALQKQFTFRVTQDSKGEMKVEKVESNQSGGTPNFDISAPQKLSSASNLSEIIKAKCLNCHSNEKAAGGLNFLQSINDNQQKSILDRITTTEAGKRMPPNGSRLNVDELAAFFQAMSAQK